MKTPIQTYFQTGVVTFMAYPALLRGEAPDPCALLEKITSDSYFQAIGVTWIKDPVLREKAAALLKASHMTVCYGAQPRLLTTGLNPNDLSEEGRQKAEDTLRDAIDEAQALGAEGIAFLSGHWSPEHKEAHYAQLLKTTENLCSYAQTKGMRVELEVFDFDIAKKSLIGPAPYAAKFAADVCSRYTNFGLMVDLSHIPMVYEDSRFCVSVLRPYITHFHIGNTVISCPEAEGYGDEHPRFGFPGGENDVPEVLDFLRVLRDEGFFRKETPMVLSFEVKPWKDENPDTVLAGAKRVLDRAWALLEEGGVQA